MTGFRSFTATNWEIFAGNLLLLICSLFYLAWWIVSYRPGSSSSSSGLLYITAAFITGIAAIALMSGGIDSLSQVSDYLPVKYVLLCSALLFILMVMVTAMGFHRPVTSELLIMHIWATLELSAVTVLYGTGRFGTVQAAAMTALVVIAFAAGIVCYVLYYGLDESTRYITGMVPLITDALVMAVFMVMMAVP